MSGAFEHDDAVFFPNSVGLEDRLDRDRFILEQHSDLSQALVALAVVDKDGVAQEGFIMPSISRRAFASM